MIDLRNDIIHNTSTIDIEKHYNIETIHSNSGKQLVLVEILFRDVSTNGKYKTKFGSKYLVEDGNHFDLFLSSCIKNLRYLFKQFHVSLSDDFFHIIENN